MRSITFDVDGVPVPQGSKTCLCRGGRPMMFENNKAWGKWRTAVAKVARLQSVTWGAHSPLMVEMIFSFPFDGTNSSNDWKVTSPDIDKLTRAVLDGITFDKAGRGVLHDDAQVVRLIVDKVFGPEPGVRIRVSDAPSVYTPLALPK